MTSKEDRRTTRRSGKVYGAHPLLKQSVADFAAYDARRMLSYTDPFAIRAGTRALAPDTRQPCPPEASALLVQAARAADASEELLTCSHSGALWHVATLQPLSAVESPLFWRSLLQRDIGATFLLAILAS